MKFCLPFCKNFKKTKKINFLKTKKEKETKNFSIKHVNESKFNERENGNFLNVINTTILVLSNFLFQIGGQEKRILNMLDISSVNAIEINTSNLRLVQEDILDEKFLFSPKTTQKTIIENEIEEIEDDEFRYRSWKNVQIGLAIGGSGLGMWFAYKGLNAWERWMKDQEQKDIEEEIELTGTYINPGAGNVDVSIDPMTGKKIIIKQTENKLGKKENENDNENDNDINQNLKKKI